jgi:multicomponent Na+:H+ antiporter subunit A
MIIAVLSGFSLAAVAPFLHRRVPRASGWVFALLPAGLFGYFVLFMGAVAEGPVIAAVDWVPSLGVSLSFYLDGLSLLFALLITGIGAFILVYASAYLNGHRLLGRFYAFIVLFMASMLGLVLADNVITLFVFWELTSVSSYFLIGFDHERQAARAAALQALLVTGIGGLALLAGFILLGSAGGSFELSELVTRGDAVRKHGLYLPILILILAGAFTKSAQVPFHFWLPSAMEAPTPVSAYLHSATMVKAGVYLLARLAPLLGGTPAWRNTLILFGGATMLVAAAMALAQRDLKRILAYSTVSSLGTLVLLIGIDTPAAAQAAVVLLLGHSLYKGALFLAAGGVDHGTGTRDVRNLGGLVSAMPMTALAGGLAALSMAGLPPTLGFIAKELLYESQLQAIHWPALIVSAAVITNAILVAAAGASGMRPFFGKRGETPRRPHEGPPALVLGPLALAALGLVLGIMPGSVSTVLSLAAGAVAGASAPLDLWHGPNRIVLLSAITLLIGAMIYALRDVAFTWADRWKRAASFGPAGWYEASVDGMQQAARVQTGLLQSGYLRYYLMTVLGATFVLVGYALVARTGIEAPAPPSGVRLYEWIVAAIILTAALAAVTARSRLTAIAALGSVGYGVALVYLLFSAPDLAMTQFGIETLSVVLFVLILYRLPRFAVFSGSATRARDVLVSLANGGLLTAVVLAATSQEYQSRIAGFFFENSLEAAKGRNTVNVILVDFRGLDTLGEITVIAVSALGVFALLKALPGKEKGSS